MLGCSFLLDTTLRLKGGAALRVCVCFRVLHLANLWSDKATASHEKKRILQHEEQPEINENHPLKCEHMLRCQNGDKSNTIIHTKLPPESVLSL